MTDNAELLKRVRMGDDEAADRLVENNMGLVYSIVGRFSDRHCEREDLMQIGAIGLIKAVKKFDISYGVQFSTYAVPMIIGEIKRFLRDDGAIKVSRSIKEVASKARQAQERLSRSLGRNPTLGELSRELGIDESDITQAFEASLEPESLQAVMSGKNGDTGISLIDRVTAEDTEEQIVDRIFLKQALLSLDAREHEIIVMRYFRGKTQSEIAKVIGVSQVQISRIEKKALMKIRDSMEA